MDLIGGMVNVSERLERFNKNLRVFFKRSLIAIIIATVITAIIWGVGASYPLLTVPREIMTLLASFSRLEITLILIIGTWAIIFIAVKLCVSGRRRTTAPPPSP